jgi:hypothetical protein
MICYIVFVVVLLVMLLMIPYDTINSNTVVMHHGESKTDRCNAEIFNIRLSSLQFQSWVLSVVTNSLRLARD